MTEQLRSVTDQEVDDPKSLIDASVLLSGKSQDVGEVSKWFLAPSAVDAQSKMQHVLTPFAPCKAPIATATSRRRGVKNAPRCFGSPFLFEPTETDCRDCKFRDRCAAQATQQALGLAPGRRLPAPYPNQLMSMPHKKTEIACMRRHIRAYYTRQARNSRRRNLAADREYRRKRRAKSDSVSIDKEFRARLAALRRAVAASRRDKRLEQLHGREIRVVRAWKARQLAQLAHGHAVSNEKVAETYRTLFGGAVSYSQYQARNDLRLIGKLETAEHVWGRFKKSAL